MTNRKIPGGGDVWWMEGSISSKTWRNTPRAASSYIAFHTQVGSMQGPHGATALWKLGFTSMPSGGA